MVTRVDFQQTVPTSAFSTTVTSPNFTTQVGDFILVFARCPAGTGGVVSGISLSLSGAVTTFGAGPITIATRQSAWAGYKVATAAQTEQASATFSTSVDYRSIHVVVYRPGSGATLSIDGSPGTATTAFGVTTITTSAITTTGGGVLCAFVGGTYAPGFSPGTTTVSSGYATIGTTTDLSSLAEKFSASALASETVTFTETVAANQMSYAIAYNVAIKEAIYTYSRPNSDVTTQWTPSSGTTHYALINETTYNDANYIYATAASQTDEVGLQAMSTPTAGTNVLINYRVQGIASGGSVTVSLYSGATLVKTDTTRTANNTSPAYYTMTVTPAEWASVSNWSNMRLRFVSA